MQVDAGIESMLAVVEAPQVSLGEGLIPDRGWKRHTLPETPTLGHEVTARDTVDLWDWPAPISTRP